eukprot:TRINITY_DN3671_c0_g1_i1.p1 TRINITY_DN3671_c0_g1~~TRINITY_DN3671_c0_g1_i1.p1  ORF type:complete len:307 (-),score=88.00 TRINITY_DN3671_c0_g1_i1:77-997(-)
MAAIVDIDDEEMRRLKREAAIRQKEDDYNKKRAMDEEKKRDELDKLKRECEEAEARKKRERLGMMKKQANLRARRAAELARLEAKREKMIKLREEAWLKKANAEIDHLIKEAEMKHERVEERLDAARAYKQEKAQMARDERAEAEIAQEEIDAKREEAIAARDLKRQIREALRTDAIKEDAQAELMSFIQNPAPVPLKQVLCGRLRPVPRVTELLASYKDAKEEFEDLKEQDFELRAVLRNQSLFQYVQDIQKAADATRIHPPEPSASDLMRKTARSPKSPKQGKSVSPSSSMRRTGGNFAKKSQK